MANDKIILKRFCRKVLIKNYQYLTLSSSSGSSATEVNTHNRSRFQIQITFPDHRQFKFDISPKPYGKNNYILYFKKTLLLKIVLQVMFYSLEAWLLHRLSQSALMRTHIHDTWELKMTFTTILSDAAWDNYCWFVFPKQLNDIYIKILI